MDSLNGKKEHQKVCQTANIQGCMQGIGYKCPPKDCLGSLFQDEKWRKWGEQQ